MDQGTTEWLSWKRDKIGSSDAATCLAMNEWATPTLLWKRIMGLPVPPFKTNWAVQKGMRWEGPARSRFELKCDMDFPAEIVPHPQYKRIVASLDGRNKEAKAILEIKIPGAEVINAAKDGTVGDAKYRKLATEWKIAKFCEGHGIVHPKYWPQVQHQAMCTGAETIYFYVCDVQVVNGVEQIVADYLVIAKPDPEFQKELLFKELQMLDFAAKKARPPLTSDDVVELDDETSVMLFAELKRVKAEYDAASEVAQSAADRLAEAKEAFEALKEDAIHHVDSFEQRHTKYTCLGVSFNKTAKGHWVVRIKDEPCNESQNLKQA